MEPVYIVVTLSSGNIAVYEVTQAHHLTRRCANVSINEQIIDYGALIAIQRDGRWYHKGGRDEITDPKALRIIGKLAHAQTLEETPWNASTSAHIAGTA
ncbi:hypothetical protein UFOVP274_74 [uncultured Caudovirales phage]|uniref:Uncharacterized protein n=1 Tax=uncultured Caudovirales phage TaxID=2100421 RepID=A0A6J5LPK4_9CAUD|nr:hypothetical protein UFOVP274_74 [uncultured Caudovirales phage]